MAIAKWSHQLSSRVSEIDFQNFNFYRHLRWSSLDVKYYYLYSTSNQKFSACPGEEINWLIIFTQMLFQFQMKRQNSLLSRTLKKYLFRGKSPDIYSGSFCGSLWTFSFSRLKASFRGNLSIGSSNSILFCIKCILCRKLFCKHQDCWKLA